jgi:anaerobic magnesium-protoporphyrin IX monomethyl ester cyclase
MIRKLLMLQPLRIYKRWPMPDDFTGLVLGSPTLAFAQLRSRLKDYQADYMDGVVRDYSLAELTRRAQAADAVLINAHSSIGSLNVEANLRHILDVCPGKPVILGGHHATAYDFEWLGRGAHFVVRNEGEETIAELLEALSRGGPYDRILGLSWRDGREFRRNPPRPLIEDLDSLPMPDWSIYDPKLYHLPVPGAGFATTAETSRGCNFSCSFCAASEMWQHRQRFKSPARVLAELRVLKRLGFSKLWFSDDNFGAEPARYAELFEGMLREGLDFKFMVFIRADTIAQSPETIRLAFRAGMRVALLGIESPVRRILKDCAKSCEFEVSEKAVAVLREAGVFIGGFFMVGYLDERQDETDATFRAAAQYSDYPIISIFEPRRGTEDFGRAVQKRELAGGDMFYHNTVRFIPSQVHVLRQYRDFYRNYLVHPTQVRKLLFGTPTQKRWFRNLYGNMARSLLSITPAKAAHPWTMVRDIYD